MAQEERPLDSNYAALFKASIFRSQLASWFQLAPVWSTKNSS
jgi:hypothetical protein